MKGNSQECVVRCHSTGCERLTRPATELTVLQMFIRLAGSWQFRSSRCRRVCVGERVVTAHVPQKAPNSRRVFKPIVVT